MTAAAIATIATVEAASSIAPVFSVAPAPETDVSNGPER
jgi:hypothetical protein